jgi:hypothetical protein
MFQPVPRKLFMTDPDRGYSWRDVGSTQQGEVDIAAITLDDREIPYEFRVVHRSDDVGDWYDVLLGAFGYSVAGTIQWELDRVFSRPTRSVMRPPLSRSKRFWCGSRVVAGLSAVTVLTVRPSRASSTN